MHQERYYEVSTMGDFCPIGAGQPRRQGRRTEPHSEPDGCHWFRDCGQCGWEGCIVESPVRYDSERGKRLRERSLAGMAQHGVPPEWLAQFFGLTAEAVAEAIREYPSAVMPNSGTEETREEAIRRRMAGESEALVAWSVGVSARQVRRWFAAASGCRMRSGTRRTDGNRWRKAVATIDTSVSPAMVALQRRCAIVRSKFG